MLPKMCIRDSAYTHPCIDEMPADVDQHSGNFNFFFIAENYIQIPKGNDYISWNCYDFCITK